jgi:hypothetical protein
MTTDSQGNIHDTTGQFATKNRDEASVELAGITPNSCPICGPGEDVGDDCCADCAYNGTEKCSDCGDMFNGDGDGWDGMCGACADQAYAAEDAPVVRQIDVEFEGLLPDGEENRLTENSTAVMSTEDSDGARMEVRRIKLGTLATNNGDWDTFRDDFVDELNRIMAEFADSLDMIAESDGGGDGQLVWKLVAK